MKKLIILSIGIFIIFSTFQSCQQKQSNELPKTSNIDTTDQDNNSLPELSVYNLPSEWKNQENKSVKLQDFKGKVVVAVMIYTTCRSSCPKLIADMKKIHDKVNKSANQNVQYVFVSIDPETDTPKRLKDFSIEKGLTGKEWTLLTGSLDDTREFAAVLGVSYKKTSPIDFAHSNIINVFDKKGVLTYQKDGLGLTDDEIVKTIERLSK